MKTSFLDKLIGRMERVDPQSLQGVVLKLAREKGFLETLFNTIQEGIIVTDAEGRITYLNAAAGQLLGIDPERAINEPLSRHFRDLDWQKIWSADKDEWRKVFTNELEVFYPQHRFISFYIVPVADEQNSIVTGMAIILRDITETGQRAESTMESERLSAIELLAAGVAHEIGDPLNSLNIHLQLMERETKKLPTAQRDRLRDDLRVARDEIARLDQIINQFLRAIRPTRPELQPTTINNVVTETLALMEREIRDRDIFVEQELAGDLPRILLDRAQLKQAFYNVIKNALQATRSGGILRIRTEADDANVTISFMDSGHGIAPEQIGQLFVPYFTTKEKGTGLGLMIVQRIVREHGGTIEVESHKDKGTTFRIKLPIHERRTRLLEAPREEVCPEMTATRPTILIVDDERNTREGLQRALQDRYEVFLAEDSQKALQVLESTPIDVMLSDLRMPGVDGMGLLRRATSLTKPPVCIMMTAYGSIENAVQAMQAGAYHYVTKPVNLDELELVVQRALNSRRIEEENVNLREQIDQKYGLEHIIGESPAMRPIFETVQQVSPSRATVLITGETGTGKELIAKAVHNLSPRKGGPFIAVHAAALPTSLLESELFGHEKGAFTGAVERRIGRFELADGGTLFLDEVGELEPQMQVKLLRVLEERAFERVGGTKTIHVDVRMVAATNRDLKKLVSEGKFRDDLFYRLSVVTVALPPLRERREDIPLLVKTFLDEFGQENNKQVRELTPEALNMLLAYDWPGNVRELRNAVEQMVVLARTERLSVRDVPAAIRGSADLTKINVVRAGMTVEDAERQLIVQALKETNGNRTTAAQKIGISRRTLHRKLKEYGLENL